MDRPQLASRAAVVNARPSEEVVEGDKLPDNNN